MWNLKRNDIKELTKQKRTHRFGKQTHSSKGEGIVRDFHKVRYTLLYLKWITNENLLYNTWGSAQWYETACMEAGFRGEWIQTMWCMYIMEHCSAIKKNEIMPFAAT